MNLCHHFGWQIVTDQHFYLAKREQSIALVSEVDEYIFIDESHYPATKRRPQQYGRVYMKLSNATWFQGLSRRNEQTYLSIRGYSVESKADRRTIRSVAD
jgi:hypothetical protein